jgi:hypothetical protein
MSEQSMKRARGQNAYHVVTASECSACRKSLLMCQTNGLLRLDPHLQVKEAAPISTQQTAPI